MSQQRLASLIDSINDGLSKVVSTFTLAMVVITFLIVVLRYGFNVGWIAMQESVMYLHAMVFMLGAAHTLKVDEHVRVDIFYRNFSPARKALVNILGTLLFLIPVNVVIMMLSLDYVARSWSLLEASQEAGGLPLVFILKSLIPAFAITMILQGLSQVLKDLMTLRNGGGQE